MVRLHCNIFEDLNLVVDEVFFATRFGLFTLKDLADVVTLRSQRL
jgi:hypothetical protein